jgi:hypothetical protein
MKIVGNEGRKKNYDKLKCNNLNFDSLEESKARLCKWN